LYIEHIKNNVLKTVPNKMLVFKLQIMSICYFVVCSVLLSHQKYHCYSSITRKFCSCSVRDARKLLSQGKYVLVLSEMYENDVRVY